MRDCIHFISFLFAPVHFEQSASTLVAALFFHRLPTHDKRLSIKIKTLLLTYDEMLARAYRRCRGDSGAQTSSCELRAKVIPWCPGIELSLLLRFSLFLSLLLALILFFFLSCCAIEANEKVFLCREIALLRLRLVYFFFSSWLHCFFFGVHFVCSVHFHVNVQIRGAAAPAKGHKRMPYRRSRKR